MVRKAWEHGKKTGEAAGFGKGYEACYQNNEATLDAAYDDCRAEIEVVRAEMAQQMAAHAAEISAAWSAGVAFGKSLLQPDVVMEEPAADDTEPCGAPKTPEGMKRVVRNPGPLDINLIAYLVPSNEAVLL